MSSAARIRTWKSGAAGGVCVWWMDVFAGTERASLSTGDVPGLSHPGEAAAVEQPSTPPHPPRLARLTRPPAPVPPSPGHDYQPRRHAHPAGGAAWPISHSPGSIELLQSQPQGHFHLQFLGNFIPKLPLQWDLSVGQNLEET